LDNFGRPLWGDLLDVLRQRIVSGALTPGQRLVEQDIASEFGISRGPVRSALTELNRLGLVVVNPRRGTEVMAFGASDVQELYELREALEVLALRRAYNVPPQVIERLRQNMDRAAAARVDADFATSVEADLEFHRELCHLSANRRLVAAWETQAEQIRAVISAAQRVGGELVLPVLNEHNAIFQALSAGEPELAQEALRRHLGDARDLLTQSSVAPFHDPSNRLNGG
jgi:GntR family transcriptional regulator of gluconate operon